MEYYSVIKNEWSSDTCYSMDAPWNCYAKGKKPDTKAYMLYDSIYMESTK